jgi:hypothetical protein
MQLEMLHMLVEEGRRMNQDGGGGGGGGGWGVCISEVEGRSDRRRRSRRFATYIQTNKQTSNRFTISLLLLLQKNRNCKISE